MALIPGSRIHAFLVFSVAHVLYWFVAFLAIRGNELSLQERLGIPLSDAALILRRSLSLTVVPAFYGGLNSVGVLVVLAVYGLVTLSIVRFDRRGLFYSGALVWVVYGFTVLVVMSAGMRS